MSSVVLFVLFRLKIYNSFSLVGVVIVFVVVVVLIVVVIVTVIVVIVTVVVCWFVGCLLNNHRS